MNTIDTISQLLHSSNSQFRLYDIGRKIEKISKEQFEKIELNQIPYPTPLQGHACIAIAFWQKKSPQPYLWLLKFPLDERGLLNQGARNHFIAIIIEALGSNLMQDANEKQEELLKSNPYLYTPAQYKLATLNSKINFELKQTPSEYLSPFLTYLSGESGWDNWQVVGVQGITDFAVRINEKENSEKLINALPHLPTEVLFPLCGALENESLPAALLNTLISLLEKNIALMKENNENNDNLLQTQQHLLRSLASNCHHIHVEQFINMLLAQDKIAAELLITLSGRCWTVLADAKMLITYFEHLIACEDQALFNSIFKDLVAIPSIRPIVFECMRSPNRSNALSQAIGQLFN
ncbi:DUF3549 family protein [Colwellia sp. 4_MG-2023]|uniref:DUF3549 family protein n=1 Tax=unclassified Colwellia TaxID=196834 RepID=UPI001C09CCD3|nr:MULTISPECIES: DUF3549 family protein [unclassified Colwellia]MBU2923923.1 DUF3549 family protein [Colwellia sp. C2M11]MDO6507617.1 DUF3549 family protein [Colwellia sp. 5_MG-2023]MDO6555613.1 DUF3549 family protein [Colwellia sp. 4_MG-2023]MDO6653006.1 DUF3549 family protein [Colwellia sp. 3_MG-2023]MDO6666007.1 DUF3549 family protein [Colwellia sp. 2_MG-2023]